MKTGRNARVTKQILQVKSGIAKVNRVYNLKQHGDTFVLIHVIYENITSLMKTTFTISKRIIYITIVMTGMRETVSIIIYQRFTVLRII